MKLEQFGFIKAKAPIVFVGAFEPTSIVDSDGNAYFRGNLKYPITVGCSVDKMIESHEADYLLVREADATSDKWKLVDENKPAEGHFIDGWVADFSKGHGEDIYQETTIREWVRGSRKERGLLATKEANETLKQRMAERAAKLADGAGKKNNGKVK